MGKNLHASGVDSRDRGLIPRLEDPLEEENGNPLQYFCLKSSTDKRSLVGYSPRCHNELDTTEHTHTHTQCKSAWDSTVQVEGLPTDRRHY